MATSVEQVEKQYQEVKRYNVQYPIADYEFPSEARIHQVQIDDEFLHVDLMDGRGLSVPLWWIPTVYNAAPEEREKYEINRSRTMIIWDPNKCAINDEIRIADYLGPQSERRQATEGTVDAVDELREEYQFDSSHAELNRFAKRWHGDQMLIPLDPDVAAVFRTPEVVNDMLRAIIANMLDGEGRSSSK